MILMYLGTWVDQRSVQRTARRDHTPPFVVLADFYRRTDPKGIEQATRVGGKPPTPQPGSDQHVLALAAHMHVKVLVRVRPLVEHELASSHTSTMLALDPQSGTIRSPIRPPNMLCATHADACARPCAVKSLTVVPRSPSPLTT